MSADAILEQIKGLSVLELAKLVKLIEEEFGVSAAAPVAVAAGPVAAAGPAAPVEEAEEQTEFTVILADIGPEKIKVIKEVRAFTGLGLREAKEAVESAPAPIKEGVSKEEAAKIREALEAVGAKVEVK